LLRGIKATSNKLAFDWVRGSDDDARWIRRARWVSDGKFYTSSGVSAGIDVTLGFVRDIHGAETAREICKYVEYIWNQDSTSDSFADMQ
jgi:transcriptional regulator GlxA family with amidase domain